MDLLETGLSRFLMDRLPPPLRVTLTDNRRAMFSYRRRPDGVGELRVARYFALADHETLEALAAYLTGKSRRLSPLVRSFADRQAPSVDRTKEARRRARPAGEHFDLAAVSAKVRGESFPAMERVTITWGRRSTPTKGRARKRTIQLGSYQPDGDLVTINPALDAPYVAPVYLEMVVYHELLHRLQALDTPKGVRPRLVHDARFRGAERRFPGYDEAMAWEKANLARLLTDRQETKR